MLKICTTIPDGRLKTRIIMYSYSIEEFFSKLSPLSWEIVKYDVSKRKEILME